MIRPLEWDERTQQAPKLEDLYLSVYVAAGDCIYSRKAVEEAPGQYRVRVFLPPVWFGQIVAYGLDSALALRNKTLDLSIDGELLHVAFSWPTDTEIPLDQEDGQGGVKQQIEDAARSEVVVVDSKGGTYGLIWTSQHKVTILGGDAAEVLGLAAGTENFREIVGERVFLRWHSASAELTTPTSSVVITGERTTGEAINTAIGG